MRIKWVRLLPRGYNFLSMMIIEQLLQSSLISTSKLRVSLKTGSRVFTFEEQNFANSKSTINDNSRQLCQPHLHCGFLFLDKSPRSVEHQDPHVRVWAKVIMINDHPSHGNHRSGSQSESSSLLYPEDHDHDHTVRLKS